MDAVHRQMVKKLVKKLAQAAHHRDPWALRVSLTHTHTLALSPSAVQMGLSQGPRFAHGSRARTSAVAVCIVSVCLWVGGHYCV